MSSEVQAPEDWEEFLRLWLLADRTRVSGSIGLSSKALLEYALGGDHPTRDRWPGDPADLERCLLTWGLLPKDARDRARPLMLAFREEVERKYPVPRRGS